MTTKHHFMKALFPLVLAIGLFGTACTMDDEYGMSIDMAEQSLDVEAVPQDVMEKLDCNDDCTCPDPPRAGCTAHHILCWIDSDTQTCRNKTKGCEYWCPPLEEEPAPVDETTP
jgi:hypothetical protein